MTALFQFVFFFITQIISDQCFGDLGYTACCPKLAAICLIFTDVLVSKQTKFGVKSMCVWGNVELPTSSERDIEAGLAYSMERSSVLISVRFSQLPMISRKWKFLRFFSSLIWWSSYMHIYTSTFSKLTVTAVVSCCFITDSVFQSSFRLGCICCLAHFFQATYFICVTHPHHNKLWQSFSTCFSQSSL